MTKQHLSYLPSDCDLPDISQSGRLSELLEGNTVFRTRRRLTMGSNHLEGLSYDVQDVAIIGAGPSGLAAAKYLVAQGTFRNIVIYEQQSEIGGVWNYSEKPSSVLHVPQVSPFCPPDPPVRPQEPASGPPVFPGPMYELLNTNIRGIVMAYTDQAFADDAPIFPSRQMVQEYLVEYARDIRQLIRFSVRVKDVQLRGDRGKDAWDIYSESTVDGEPMLETFDAVVVANGHYDTMFIPEIQNIKAFHEAHPEIITHSKLYRRPDAFAGKKVVVVGNSASGLDIAQQISRVCKAPLLLSVRSPTPPIIIESAGCLETAPIEEFLVHERGVRFRDGRVETDIDAVVFCTGYLYSFPFFRDDQPWLLNDGRRINGLYLDLIHIDHPTLAFPGLPKKIVPFPLCESQAAVFARVWSNVLSLPSREAMKAWEETQARERSDDFFVYPKGGDARYITEIHDWIMRNPGPGKEPPIWSDRRQLAREVHAEVKLRFDRTGRCAKSLQELGFSLAPPLVKQE